MNNKLMTIAAIGIAFAGLGTTDTVLAQAAARTPRMGIAQTAPARGMRPGAGSMRRGAMPGARGQFAAPGQGRRNELRNGLPQGPKNGPKQGMKQDPKNGPKQGMKQGPKQGMKNGFQRGPQQGFRQGPQAQRGPQQGFQRGPQQGFRQGPQAQRGPQQGFQRGMRGAGQAARGRGRR